MKIIAIGDTHGRDVWKRVKEQESNYDKFVFIGDYFDSREDIQPYDQADNFRDILLWKKEEPDKVVLIIGNHDYHYMSGVGNESYSLYSMDTYRLANPLLMGALEKDFMQICFKYENLLFSHAGVSTVWLKNKGIPVDENMASSINQLFKDEIHRFKFTDNMEWSSNGNDVTQSPIWIRPQSLLKSHIDGIMDIVGHTQVSKIPSPDEWELPFLLIDILGEIPQYVVFENGTYEVKTLKE